MEMIEKN